MLHRLYCSLKWTTLLTCGRTVLTAAPRYACHWSTSAASYRLSAHAVCSVRKMSSLWQGAQAPAFGKVPPLTHFLQEAIYCIAWAHIVTSASTRHAAIAAAASGQGKTVKALAIQLHEHTCMLASAFALPSCSSSAYAPSHFHCSAC